MRVHLWWTRGVSKVRLTALRLDDIFAVIDEYLICHVRLKVGAGRVGRNVDDM